MKAAANYITMARIGLLPLLFFVKPLGTGFYMIYILCGFSDMLDGYIARKTKTASTYGEKLDSVADLMMVAVVIYRLYPVIDLPPYAVCLSLIIIGIRMISLVAVYVKYRTFGILHTYGNKLTGLALFVSLILMWIFPLDVLVVAIGLLGISSASEELIIHLISPDLDRNRKSIFSKG